MALHSGIEWTEATWNPVTGCSKISSGCRHCYAERMARRLKGMRVPAYANGFAVTCHDALLSRPLAWKRPRRIFVNSMGDLFHEDVPVDFIQRAFLIMVQAKHHIFQILTKRAGRLAELAPGLPWPTNVWMGVTVESQEHADRVDQLRCVPAAVRFLSCEPLLSALTLDLSGIHWCIAGGETGPGARAMRPEWAAGLRDQCFAVKVPFFFKQWGGVRKAGRLLEGRTWDELPEAL